MHRVGFAAGSSVTKARVVGARPGLSCLKLTEANPHLAIDRLVRLRDLVTEALQMADEARLTMLGIHLHEALLNLNEIIERAEAEKPSD